MIRFPSTRWQGFNKALGQIIGHGVTNSTRSFTRALTRSRSAGSDPAAHYASQLDRLTAAFAYCSDIALTMGGKIKVRVGRPERREVVRLQFSQKPPMHICSIGSVSGCLPT